MFFNENIIEMRTCKLINNPIYLTLISLPAGRWEEDVRYSMWLLARACRYAGGGVEVQTYPIGLLTKMHNKENITLLALLSLFFFAMTWTPR